MSLNRVALAIGETLGGTAVLVGIGRAIVWRPEFVNPHLLRSKELVFASTPVLGRIVIALDVLVAGWAVGWCLWEGGKVGVAMRKQVNQRAPGMPVMLQAGAVLLFCVQLALFFLTKPDDAGRFGFGYSDPGVDARTRWGMVYLSSDLWMTALGVISFAVALCFVGERSIIFLDWLRRRRAARVSGSSAAVNEQTSDTGAGSVGAERST